MNHAIRAGRFPQLKVEDAVRVGAHILVLAAGIALLLTQKLNISAYILIVGTVVSWFFGRQPSRGRLWEVASFLYLLFFFLDLFRISHSLAPSLVHLFIFILINKLFNLHGIRDYYQLFLLTFLTILAASSLSAEVEMFYVITTYIVLLIWNLVSVNLFFEWKTQGGSPAFPFSLFSLRYIFLVIGVGLATFLIAMGIFFVIPRMQLGFFGNMKAAKIQHVSGFSQKVNLGDIARIDENQGVAMRVRVSGKRDLYPKRFYWRGIAFDHYDGKSWSTSNSGTRFLYEDSGGVFYNSGGSGLQTDQMIRQEFYLEPLDTRVIFGADRVLRLRGNFGAVTRDNNGTFTGMNRAEHYEVYSRPTSLLHQRSQSGSEIPEHVLKYYLQLPFRSTEVEQLSAEIVGNRTSLKERTDAIVQYLRKNYRYATTDLPINQIDPVAEFLFRRKSGHCEYFATSMVVLLRYQNVPSRLINGFLEGEYNELGEFYLVRQSDAHSWVEVYLDGNWVPYDPSPVPVEASGMLRSLFDFRKALESIHFFWDRYVLIFSAQDQLDAIHSIRDEYRNLGSRAKAKSALLSELLLTLDRMWKKYRFIVTLVAGAIVVTLFALRMLWQRRRRVLIRSTPILFYREMLAILERKGFSRDPSTTPAEFVQNIRLQLPEEIQPDVLRLTDLFYRARFGNYPLNKTESSEVEASLLRLQEL